MLTLLVCSDHFSSVELKGLASGRLTGKRISEGPMTDGLAHALRSTFHASCIFPLGAAAKALLPGQTPDQVEWRPTSDHTRTGLNAATDMTGLWFALTALEEIS